MKYIITEEQNIRLRALRRLDAVDELIEYRLRMPFTFDICNRYDKEELLDHIISWANEDMYYDYFSDIDDDGEMWHKVWNIYNQYITIKYSKKIFDFYERKCGK
jgi:hypothetical protein